MKTKHKTALSPAVHKTAGLFLYNTHNPMSYLLYIFPICFSFLFASFCFSFLMKRKEKEGGKHYF